MQLYKWNYGIMSSFYRDYFTTILLLQCNMPAHQKTFFLLFISLSSQPNGNDKIRIKGSDFTNWYSKVSEREEVGQFISPLNQTHLFLKHTKINESNPTFIRRNRY